MGQFINIYPVFSRKKQSTENKIQFNSGHWYYHRRPNTCQAYTKTIVTQPLMLNPTTQLPWTCLTLSKTVFYGSSISGMKHLNLEKTHSFKQTNITITRFFLHWIEFSIDKTFEVNIPNITESKSIIPINIQMVGSKIKPNYFISILKFHSFVSSQNWLKEGIAIGALEGKRIYPFYRECAQHLRCIWIYSRGI